MNKYIVIQIIDNFIVFNIADVVKLIETTEPHSNNFISVTWQSVMDVTTG